MKDDLISRQAAIDALTHKWDGMVTSVFDVINSLPSAQPDLDSAYTEGYTQAEAKYRKMWDEMQATQPDRKTGKWINAYPDIEPNPMLMYGICSVCGFEQSISDKLQYCPSCGARMVQEGEDNDG